jgi:hypothetical protein
MAFFSSHIDMALHYVPLNKTTTTTQQHNNTTTQQHNKNKTKNTKSNMVALHYVPVCSSMRRFRCFDCNSLVMHEEERQRVSVLV